MIFVSTGTESYSFKRLVSAIDSAKGSCLISDNVVIQTVDRYPVLNCQVFPILPNKKMSDYIKKADVYICHAGVGSILMGLKLKKNPLVVPRYAKLREHIDDHQLDIANDFKNRNLIDVSYLEDNLIDKIISFPQRQKELFVYTPEQNKGKLLQALSKIINEC